MRDRLPPPHRLLLALLTFVLAGLAGCASLTSTVDISREQLQAALARRFPYEVRPAGLLLLRIGLPRLELLPQSNRVRLDLPVEASERITRNGGRGELALSFGLRYEAGDATLRAVDVRVEDLVLQGLPEPWRHHARLVGGMVAQNLLEGFVLHTLRPEDLARADGRTPGAIRVTPRGLSIELVPRAGPAPARSAPSWASLP